MIKGTQDTTGNFSVEVETPFFKNGNSKTEKSSYENNMKWMGLRADQVQVKRDLVNRRQMSKYNIQNKETEVRKDGTYRKTGTKQKRHRDMISHMCKQKLKRG